VQFAAMSGTALQRNYNRDRQHNLNVARKSNRTRKVEARYTSFKRRTLSRKPLKASFLSWKQVQAATFSRNWKQGTQYKQHISEINL